MLTDKHGTCLVPPKGVSLEEALVTIGELIGCENVRAVSRMFHKIVVFVSNVPQDRCFRLECSTRSLFSSQKFTSHTLLCRMDSLVLGDDRYVPVLSWDTPASKILLSNVLPTLSEEEILQKLGQSVLWCRELLNLPCAPWMGRLNTSKRSDGFAMLFLKRV